MLFTVAIFIPCESNFLANALKHNTFLSTIIRTPCHLDAFNILFCNPSGLPQLLEPSQDAATFHPPPPGRNNLTYRVGWG